MNLSLLLTLAPPRRPRRSALRQIAKGMRHQLPGCPRIRPIYVQRVNVFLDSGYGGGAYAPIFGLKQDFQEEDAVAAIVYGEWVEDR